MRQMMSWLGMAVGGLIVIGGCGVGGADPNVIGVSGSDARMNEAIKEARSSVGTFLEALKNPRPGMSGFAVKIPLGDGSRVEHVWVNQVRYDGTRFHGVLNNRAIGTTSVKLGDAVSARPEEISDWMYLQGRGLVGGYTIRAVRDGLTASEREAFDRGAPFVVEGAEQSAARAPLELIGTWDVLSTDGGGGPTNRSGVRMEISEDSIKMVASNGATKPMGKIAAVNASSEPKKLDLWLGGKVGEGIYELTGDGLRLIVCDPGQPRPKELKGQRAGMLFTLRRHQ